MSESDTMFEWDQRCTTVQLRLSTDPSYDNRTIASTLKMQIWTAQRLRAQLNTSDDPLEVMERKATSCHLTSSKSAWKSTPKCTWMYWRVWWSSGATRWPVADPGCGSRTRHWPTSPKRPRLGFRRSTTTLYPSLTGPPPPPTWTCWTTLFGHTLRTSLAWPPTTPKPAWSPPSAEYLLSCLSISLLDVIQCPHSVNESFCWSANPGVSMCMYLPNSLHHGQDVTQGQYLSRALLIWFELSFLSPRLVAIQRLKSPVCLTIQP